MGPEMDLSIRRTRPAAADLEKEAMKRALIHKKKVRAWILSFLLFQRLLVQVVFVRTF